MMFQEVQTQFINYIKQPNNPLPKGIDESRMVVYRELFFNNMNGFISSAFPVLKSLYQEELWLALIQDFFEHHQCKTPIFVEIAQEFIIFLQHEYQPRSSDPIFMLPLAHYEYMELVVSVAQLSDSHKNLDNIEQQAMALSSSAKVLQYEYEVHKISADYLPSTPVDEPQYFCLYRDDKDEVIFLQLNPLTAQTLGYIEQHEGINWQELIYWLQQQLSSFDSEQLELSCQQMLIDMANRGVVKAYIHPT